MHTRKRLVWSLALTTVIALTAACGGQAEEPVEEPAPAEEPAPLAEAAPVPEPLPEPEEPAEPAEPEEPAEPAEPQLEGEIVEIEDAQEMDWFNPASREEPGRYYWVVQLRNDTTQTLDITVTFDFLDENEATVKTDRSTVRVSPAEVGTFRVEGEMDRDLSRSVDGYTYTWGWRVVESS